MLLECYSIHLLMENYPSETGINHQFISAAIDPIKLLCLIARYSRPEHKSGLNTILKTLERGWDKWLDV